MEKNLNRYKFCEECLNRSDFSLDEEDFEQLEEFCFTLEWEEKLEEIKESQRELKKFLKDMQRECEIRIENLPEYQLFKEKLKDKLK